MFPQPATGGSGGRPRACLRRRVEAGGGGEG
jgi:hypothetical protein